MTFEFFKKHNAVLTDEAIEGLWSGSETMGPGLADDLAGDPETEPVAFGLTITALMFAREYPQYARPTEKEAA